MTIQCWTAGIRRPATTVSNRSIAAFTASNVGVGKPPDASQQFSIDPDAIQINLGKPSLR